jgi:hypothetical protein
MKSIPSSDPLATCLGTDTAAEMREWALGTLHKQVRLADPPWVRRGNTGAVLAVVEFVPAVESCSYFPSEDRLIVKVHPRGDLAAEASRHTLATEVDCDFAAQHLVPQKHSRVPLKDGRFFSFQEIVFDLNEAYPLTQVTHERQPMVAARAAELVLVEWNKTEQRCRTIKQPARSYLLDELRGALKIDHGTYAWAEHVGLLELASTRIRIPGDDPSRPVLNPVALAGDTSVLGTTELTFLVGFSHGDLHADNILARVPIDGVPLLQETRLIDLATFEPEASLSRDIATLILSLVREEVRTPMRPGEDAKLIELVLNPENRTITPQIAPYVVEAVRDVYGARRRIQPKFQDLWHAQYLLSVVAQALIHTSYDNVGSYGQWWYFRLAAHAAECFTSKRREFMFSAADETRYVDRADAALAENFSRAQMPQAAEVPVIGYPVSGRDAFCTALGPDLTAIAKLLGIPGPLPDARSLWDRVESQRVMQQLTSAAIRLGRQDLVDILTITCDPPGTGRPIEPSMTEKLTSLADRMVEAVHRAAAATSPDEMEVLSIAPRRLTIELRDLLDTIALPDTEPRDYLEWRMEAQSQYWLTRSGLDRLIRLLPENRASARVGMHRADLLADTADAARADLAALLDLLAEDRASS